MLLATLLLCSMASGAPVLGVDLVPLSRSDFVWIAEDQLSETLVGEFDGLVTPALNLYGGFWQPRSAWVFTLGVGATRTTDWNTEGRRVVSAAGIRPAVDYQRYLLEREVGRPTLWVGGGVHLTIPIAVDYSGSYTEEEAAAAAEGNQAIRSRIGNAGVRGGLGAEYRVNDSVTLGFRYHLGAHVGQSFSEDAWVVSTLIYGEAGLRVQLEF